MAVQTKSLGGTDDIIDLALEELNAVNGEIINQFASGEIINDAATGETTDDKATEAGNGPMIQPLMRSPIQPWMRYSWVLQGH